MKNAKNRNGDSERWLRLDDFLRFVRRNIPHPPFLRGLRSQ